MIYYSIQCQRVKPDRVRRRSTGGRKLNEGIAYLAAIPYIGRFNAIIIENTTGLKVVI